jgi:hypothetical protein
MSARHLDVGTLVDYWIGETDDATTQAIDEHLMGCDACGAEMDAVIALAAGVRGAFAAGRVGTYLSAGFVTRLVDRGVRVREYRVPLNGSVQCGVGPDDQMLLSRLQLPPGTVRRIDAVVTRGEFEERREDVPFDATTGEVLFTPRLAETRAAPAHDLLVRLLAVDDAGGRRELGHYTMHHRPWAG